MQKTKPILARRLASFGTQATDSLRQIKALIILGGAVRPSPLLQGISRSPFDLPLGDGERLLDRWIAHAAALVEARDLGSLTIRLMIDAKSPAPAPPRHAKINVVIERDPFDFRGTGGVLHDLARSLADDDRLLVVSGAQLPIAPLTEMTTLLATGADATTLSHADGSPSALMLLRCGALRDIPDIGFVDLKEQALPAIARQHVVHAEEAIAASLPIRTARDYLTALRTDHRRQRGEDLRQDPYAEDWQAEFSVVEPGASVDARARLFDSVVLEGGTVAAEAVLVRTVVCPGGHVKAGKRVVDGLVTASGITHHAGAA